MSKTRFCALLAVAMLATLGRAAQAGDTSDVTLNNQSEVAIHHMFLSPVDQETWGADQLGDHVVGAGETFLLKGVPCAEFHLKLIDEDGDECIVAVPEVCGQDQQWNISHDALLTCEGYGAAGAEGEEGADEKEE
jgi:hypothetical protein